MTLYRENERLIQELTEDQEHIIQSKSAEELEDVLDMLKNPSTVNLIGVRNS